MSGVTKVALSADSIELNYRFVPITLAINGMLVGLAKPNLVRCCEAFRGWLSLSPKFMTGENYASCTDILMWEASIASPTA
jgi:hypothetical protein